MWSLERVHFLANETKSHSIFNVVRGNHTDICVHQKVHSGYSGYSPDFLSEPMDILPFPTPARERRSLTLTWIESTNDKKHEFLANYSVDVTVNPPSWFRFFRGKIPDPSRARFLGVSADLVYREDRIFEGKPKRVHGFRRISLAVTETFCVSCLTFQAFYTCTTALKFHWITYSSAVFRTHIMLVCRRNWFMLISSGHFCFRPRTCY